METKTLTAALAAQYSLYEDLLRINESRLIQIASLQAELKDCRQRLASRANACSAY